MTYKEIYEAVTITNKDDFEITSLHSRISYCNKNPSNNLPNINVFADAVYLNYIKNGEIYNENGLAIVRLNKETLEIEHENLCFYSLGKSFLGKEEWETELNRKQMLNTL